MIDRLLSTAIENFDIIEFLEEQGIGYSYNSKNVGIGWLGIEECPYCGISRYHFAVNLENKSFNCWNCIQGKVSLVVYIATILNISYNEAADYILGDMVSDYDDLEDAVLKIFNPKESIPLVTSHNTNMKLPQNVQITKHLILTKPFIQRFFLNRNLNHVDATNYNLRIGIEGISKNKLLIPVTINKKIVSYQIRSLSSKYYKNEGPLKHFLYQQDKIPKGSKIIPVEGFLDFVQTDKFVNKYYSNKYYVTTAFSKTFSEQQIKILHEMEPSEIIYFLDRDAWFEYNKTESLFNCKTRFLVPPVEKGDPGNCREKDFLKLFHENGL